MKIRILKSFPTTHYGFLVADTVVEVDPVFGDYAVKRMNAAAEVVQAPAKKKAAKK